MRMMRDTIISQEASPLTANSSRMVLDTRAGMFVQSETSMRTFSHTTEAVGMKLTFGGASTTSVTRLTPRGPVSRTSRP